jgi:integrase
MARYAEGWKIFLPPGRKTYAVRFTHNGARVERSTGERDQGEAAKAGARIYADHVQRDPPKRTRVRRVDSASVEDCVAAWLSSDSTIGRRTVPIWTLYGSYWCARWVTLVDVTTATCGEYRNDRLRLVLADTVRKELGALRRFLKWCSDHGHLQRAVDVPFVPKKATGSRHTARRRSTAPEISPEQIETILAALPEWAARIDKDAKPYPVRARFIVAYETGLRPSFLDDLTVPTHYRRGEASFRITSEADKNRYGRRVPLSKRAREALDAVAPDVGPIFGKHDYRAHTRSAAMKALPRAAAEAFTGAHFRSARATHVLERTGNIPGAMHLFGWKLVTTASKYAKASERAAEDVIAAMDNPHAKKARRSKAR